MRILYTAPSLAERADTFRDSSLDEVFECVRDLSYGGQCRVAKHVWRESGLPVVIKSYTKGNLCSISREQVDTELQVHSSLACERVTPLLVALEDERCIHLVLQWADGGDLRSFLGSRSSGHLSEHAVKEELVRPLLHVLSLLELQGVVHRDLKPENVLLHDGKVQLADFGLAVYTSQQLPHMGCQEATAIAAGLGMAVQHAPDSTCCPPSPASEADLSCISIAEDSLDMLTSSNSSSAHDLLSLPQGLHATACNSAYSSVCRSPSSSDLLASAGGTPLYTAPEVLLAMFQSRAIQDTVSHKNDVWALGVLALEALSGSHPLSKSSNLLYSVAYHTAFKVPTCLSAEATDFISLATHKDPAVRPSASQLLAHSWMQVPVSSPTAGTYLGGSLALADVLHVNVKGSGSLVSPRHTPRGTPTSAAGAISCKTAALRSPFSLGSKPYEPDVWEF